MKYRNWKSYLIQETVEHTFYNFSLKISLDRLFFYFISSFSLSFSIRLCLPFRPPPLPPAAPEPFPFFLSCLSRNWVFYHFQAFLCFIVLDPLREWLAHKIRLYDLRPCFRKPHSPTRRPRKIIMQIRLLLICTPGYGTKFCARNARTVQSFPPGSRVASASVIIYVQSIAVLQQFEILM